MFEKRFLLVLVVAAIFESTYQQLERSVPSCTTNGERFCLSCTTQASCALSAGVLKQYNTTCSGSTPLCGPDSSTPPKMACTTNTVADCTCTGTGLSYKIDPYNDQWYIICSGTTATYVDCGTGQFYNEATRRCGNTPPTTTTTTPPAPSMCSVLGAGVHDDPNTCDGFNVCTSADSEPLPGKCSPPTEYFNPVINDCQTPESLFTCPPGEFGTFADPFDCRRYYVCFDGELFETGCCNSNLVYNAVAEECTADPIPDTCPLSTECAI